MEASSCSNPVEELAYKSHVHFYAPNIVTTKLSSRDTYDVWKTQMLCLLESHDMLTFIEKSVIVKEKVDEKLWRRSDALVKGWLFGSLSEQALKLVVSFFKTNHDFTSKDVWDKLRTIYGPSAPLLQDTEQEIEEAGKKVRAAELLYEATLYQDFESIENILSKKVVTLRDKITINGDTALHIAVGTTKNIRFLEKMLDRATKDNHQPLDMPNLNGSNLLHVASIVGNTEAAEILLERNINSLYDKNNEGQTPLDIALSDENTSPYWLKRYINTRKIDAGVFFDDSGYKLLVNMISSKNYWLTFNLDDDYLATFLSHADTLLMAFAQNFPSRRLSFWRRTMPKWLIKSFDPSGPTDYFAATMTLNTICNLIKFKNNDFTSYHRYYNNAVLEATRQNAYKVVKIIVSNFPNAIWSANEEGHNIIQYAVINRSENIYNLLYQMSEHKNYYKTIKDRFGNNLLHLAGRLAPTNKLDPISGVALRIQYELQWFKEVEGFVSHTNITQKNLFDETPQMVFTRQHKDLVIDGEKWMKATAKSYTITTALITTIVFAAAITVPGGNKQDNGIPVFTYEAAFTIFAVSDAISLFTSLTSLLMFLSILTSKTFSLSCLQS